MRAFTPNQQAILQGIGQTLISYIGIVHELHNFAANRIVALQNLLFKKGIITKEEMDYAIKENEARVAVETVFSPELKAAEEEFTRLVRQAMDKKPAGKVRGRQRKRRK